MLLEVGSRLVGRRQVLRGCCISADLGEDCAAEMLRCWIAVEGFGDGVQDCMRSGILAFKVGERRCFEDGGGSCDLSCSYFTA